VGLAAVVAVHAAVHAAVLVALALVRPDLIVPPGIIDTDTYNVPVPPEPVDTPPARPRREEVNPVPPDFVDSTPRSTDDRQATVASGTTIATDGELDGEPVISTDPAPTREPTRVAAVLDPTSELEPPYPPIEQRAERDGRVRLRLTIGADGRVRQVARLFATSEAFWRAAERHALARWRFRPATLDGEPVESSKVMTLHFRIEEH